MNLFLEAVLVGIYTCTIFMFFSPFIKNFYVLLLVCGFCKHLLGYVFNIWSWYCNNGEACLKILKQQNVYKANTINLFIDSSYEAIIFLFFGTILQKYLGLQGKWLFFIMGLLLHILGDYTEIHTSFCKKNCEKI